MLIIAPPNKDKQVQQFKQDVQNKYDIKDLGEASSFLNIRIRRDVKAKKLWISRTDTSTRSASSSGLMSRSRRSQHLCLRHTTPYLMKDRPLRNRLWRCKKSPSPLTRT